MSEELLELVKQAQQGDAYAFEKMIQLKQRDILYITSCYCKPEDIEDNAQEAMVNMYRKLSELKNPEAFVGWMYSIIKNTCSNYSRRDKAQKRNKGTLSLNAVIEKEEDQAESLRELRTEFLPDDYIEQQEQQQLLAKAIDTLQQDYRECLLLFYYEELTYKEIAEVLGVSQKKVANNLVRGRAKLKQYLERHTQGEIFFSAIPVGTLPVLTRFFCQKASEQITDEMVYKASQGIHQFLQQSALPGVTAGVTAAVAQQQAAVGVGVVGKVMTSVAAVGLIGGAIAGVYYLSQPPTDPTPVAVVTEAPTPQEKPTLTPTPVETLPVTVTPTPTPVETVAETSALEESSIPEETPVEEPPLEETPVEEPEPVIETLEDMIGVELAAELAGYEAGQVAPQDWEAFVQASGLQIVREGADTSASYVVYLREEQDRQLLVAIRNPDEGERLEVRYQFGEIRPLENMIVYLLWF